MFSDPRRRVSVATRLRASPTTCPSLSALRDIMASWQRDSALACLHVCLATVHVSTKDLASACLINLRTELASQELAPGPVLNQRVAHVRRRCPVTKTYKNKVLKLENVANTPKKNMNFERLKESSSVYLLSRLACRLLFQSRPSNSCQQGGADAARGAEYCKQLKRSCQPYPGHSQSH